MNDNKRRRFISEAELLQSPPMHRPQFSNISQASSRLNNQNKYEKFSMGAQWKNFVLPEFVEDESQSRDSRVTFLRVNSTSRMLQEIQGFNEILDSKVQRIMKQPKRNSIVVPPLISPFLLKHNQDIKTLDFQTQQLFHDLEKGSHSSRSRQESCQSLFAPQIGVQTEPSFISKYTEQQIQLLKEEVLYLRRHVYSSYEDCLKKNIPLTEAS